MSAKTTSEDSQPQIRILVGLLQKRPRLVYRLMVLCLVLSVGLSFLWRDQHSSNLSAGLQSRKAVHQNYDQVMGNVQSLGLIWQLQEEAEQLLAKPELTHEDSLRLLHVCQRLEALNKQLNPIKK